MATFPQTIRAIFFGTVTAALSATVSSEALAQPAFELELLTPSELRVSPGGSVAHALRIRNVGTVAGPALVEGTWFPYNVTFDTGVYQFCAASDPRCGTIEVPSFHEVDFTTAALDPGQALDCLWQVNRPAGAPLLDAWLAWRSETDSEYDYSTLTLFGTLTNTTVSASTLSFDVDAQGIGRSTIELSVQNLGEHPIDSQITQSCRSPVPGANQLLIEDSFGPGACGQVLDVQTGCNIVIGGVGDGPYGYQIPELQPGDTYRCTFTARTSLPYQGPVASDMSTTPVQISASAGNLLDTELEDNLAAIVLGPTGSSGAPVALDALERLPLFALGLLLAIAALWSLPFRRSGTVRAKR